MVERKQFQMTDDDLNALMDACKPSMAIALHLGPLLSQQERANAAWCALGDKMGFEGMTVRPEGRDDRVFTAVAKPARPAAPMIHVVFDGPPSHDGCRFVEVETPDGRSVNIGDWHAREDGLWELRIPLIVPTPQEPT